MGVDGYGGWQMSIIRRVGYINSNKAGIKAAKRQLGTTYRCCRIGSLGPLGELEFELDIAIQTTTPAALLVGVCRAVNVALGQVNLA